ncbi:MAG: TIGR02996 domain-containing protein [Deltaproteobacteria bacterium]|nr:TIGR02996 domain-containing protein [Deltaproteobacteria bacterium]
MAGRPSTDDSATTGEWRVDDWETDQKTRDDPDTPVEQRFLLQLRDNPEDLAMRMVFADWLEEHDQHEKAEVVRLLAEQPAEGTPAMRRLRLASTTLDREWMAIVSRAPIERCEAPTFRFRCPKSWEALTSTDDPTVRFCGACRSNVYFCSTLPEVREHAEALRCVAFSARLSRASAIEEYDHGDTEVLMGDIDPGFDEP